MKILSIQEQSVISGGEILPGWPADGVICTDVKLLVNAHRGEPGLDVTAAVRALLKQCNTDFWSPEMAREYVMNGGVPLPPMP
ncbi:MAG: hypothetical protein U1E78_01850 [Gammaproteobacteria bacterium]